MLRLERNIISRSVPSNGLYRCVVTTASWSSPDLWVRNADPATDPIGDPAYGVEPPNQSGIGGADNWVRARVKNVGTANSTNFFVRVYLCHWPGTRFLYPADYIPSINTGDPIPNPRSFLRTTRSTKWPTTRERNNTKVFTTP